MRKKLLNNLGLKIVSLVLAFLLWFMVVQTTDPKDDKDIGNIPVTLINTELLDKQNKVYEILDNTNIVRVTVHAPRSILKSMRSSDVIAEADVSKLTDINTVPITFTSISGENVDIRGSHEVVRLSVEEKDSKYVALKTNVVGEPAEGFIVGSSNPDQNRIEVSGPKSLVEEVKYAGVMIDVADATANLTANVEIHLYDKEGNSVEHKNLVTNVDHVKLSVEILAVKEVPIKLQPTGEPAEGYLTTGEVGCDPAVVKIAGSSFALSRVSAITIPKEKLDISQMTESFEETISIYDYLPDNVKLADNDFNGRINVKIGIAAVAERTIRISPQNVSISNLPEDSEYEIEMEDPEEGYYSLKVKGLKEQVNAVKQDEIIGTVDLGEWMKKENMRQLKPGIYSVPVTVTLNKNVEITLIPTARIIIKEGE